MYSSFEVLGFTERKARGYRPDISDSGDPSCVRFKQLNTTNRKMIEQVFPKENARVSNELYRM
jgi:hypothetical protein